jgi:teichuronic acid biosynthesis glycosyltransferase TuaG
MRTESPFFSITIPAYNRAFILEETLRSVQMQSFSNWEVIVVDDGSTDNTASLIEKIAHSDARIRYVYQKNAERSVARNNGADHAKGRYLLFLDSDDAFESDHLQLLYNLLEEQRFPVGMVFSNVTYLTDKGYETPEIPKMEKGKEFEYMLLQPITPSRVCVHRDVFKTFRFDPQITIVEDMVLWVCIASKFPVFQLDKPSAVYRIHGDNSVDLSRNSYLKRYHGLLRLFNHADYAKVNAEIPDAIRRHLLAECSFNMARHHEFVKEYGSMNRMLWRSFRHKPDYRNKERLYMLLSHLPVISSLINKTRS